jgi:hypothetical protein
MWHQFAERVAGRSKPVRCPTCDRWFLVDTANELKASRVFCGDYCKPKDYRRRRAEALRLIASGRRPAAIAKETGTKMATVKKWLASAKGKRD